MMFFRLAVLASCLGIASVSFAQQVEDSYSAPRCQVIPLADQQVSFQIDGVEKFRWNFSENYPRPFFYPFRGPSGAMLTRMGHPGAPDHDHHQSIWFANNQVNGLNFWGNTDSPGSSGQAKIRQRQWYAYVDGEDEASMACLLDWNTPQGDSLMQQELVAAIIPMPHQEYALEIQFTLRPSHKTTPVELGKTNFGFLAVRVAKSISASFGGGSLTGSEGHTGEQDNFAKSARWMDYSGPVAIGQGAERTSVVEGITVFDHPRNVRYPTPWHVRNDGWMGAAVNLNESFTLDQEAELTLRYLIHAHRGPYEPGKASKVGQAFADRPRFVLSKGTKPNYQYDLRREQ